MYVTDDHTFEVRVDSVDCTSLAPYWAKSREWCYTDPFGHQHRWVPDRRKPHRLTLPSLRAESETEYDEYGEPYEKLTYYCKQCGVEVGPGYEWHINRSGFVQTLPGIRHHYIDGRLVSQRMFNAVIEYYLRRHLSGGQDRPISPLFRMD